MRFSRQDTSHARMHVYNGGLLSRFLPSLLHLLLLSLTILGPNTSSSHLSPSSLLSVLLSCPIFVMSDVEEVRLGLPPTLSHVSADRLRHSFKEVSSGFEVGLGLIAATTTPRLTIFVKSGWTR